MKAALALALVALVGVVSADWYIAWEDNFDGGNLADRWNFELGCNGWGNNELQCYTNNRGENARQENGVLIIQARKEWWGDGSQDQPFTSARMTSKANWLHGKMEIRARLPKGKHLWPAFWMMPANSEYGGWPRSGEIDIMEYRGQRPQQMLGTLHFGPAWDNKGQAGTGERNFPFDFSQDWHTFAIDWSPQQIMWLVDDQVIHTETLQRNFWPGLYTANGQPFDKNFFIILNLAVGGNFFGGEPFDPEEANGWEKNTFEIDWVRKWEWR
jgi:beta-glucanase (GH16 family)